MPLGVISKVRPLDKSRKNCFVVATRNLRASEEYGRWEAISRMGYKVVCPSKKERYDLVLYVGNALYPDPSGVAANDDAYMQYLVDHHFKIAPYEVTGKHEMTFAELTRGWLPNPEDLTTGKSSPGILYLTLEENDNAGSQFPFANMVRKAIRQSLEHIT